ncbi:MAG: DUF2760 domain-containing protein [Polyangiaceae bacterium]
MSFVSRLVFAYVAFFRILFDGAFAARASSVKDAMPELPPSGLRAAEPEPIRKSLEPPQKKVKTIDEVAVREAGRRDGALWLLGHLQREGRFVDFLEQDVTSFKDQEVGEAARVVHAGCKKAIASVLEVKAVREEEEGSAVTLQGDYDKAANKLTGDVKGSAPYKGTLRHKGWRAIGAKLPTPTKGDEPTVLCPAEIEL